jgi:hypothetical protein
MELCQATKYPTSSLQPAEQLCPDIQAPRSECFIHQVSVNILQLPPPKKKVIERKEKQRKNKDKRKRNSS